MSESLRPWIECVALHPDVLSDEFSEDVFALDLGALSDRLLGADAGLPAAELPRVPAVYRDADSFFRASYLTGGLRSLLDDVFGRLAGARGNRVLKLLTPFGGGKSHTLAALLHGARSRAALDVLPEAAGLPRPGGVRVAVFDGQFFDATTGKRAPAGTFAARTAWGWMAWALGGRDGYEVVRAQDEARVAPGGDEIVALLRRGPSLILIDELLEYLISAGGVRVERTTLRDETLSFLKRLTVAVGAVDDAVLVYSLQSSKRESLEYTSLLRTVEHLAARKDQRREPVEGNEILNVIQRRLLAAPPDPRAAGGAAEAWRQVFTRTRHAYAQSDAERRQADEEGLALRDRITASYPFHPALIDVMRERWAAVPEFQRTRGALRFLASCLRAAHRAGGSRALLGPGDVPIRDADVRLAFFKEVGQREDFLACLEHDFVGANARTRRIDARRAREVTAEAGRQPATRLATTVLLCSFGGLRRAGGADGALLPPGIGETDLLGVAVGPDLDSTTAQACLKELREQCLYLHFDGVRYCFRKDPNVTLLVEQEADAVARDEAGVRARVQTMIEERLAGHPAAVVWPAASGDVPDRDARFLVAYLPLEFATLSAEEQEETKRDLFEHYGNRPREFRNGLGLAAPSADQVEVLRRAVRYLLAIERVGGRWREHNLTDAQKGQLRERRATEGAAAESALLKLYAEVWLPASADGALSMEAVRMGGRPLQTTLDAKKRARIHERLTELLTTVQKKVFGSVAPGKIVELYRLGAGDPGGPGASTRLPGGGNAPNDAGAQLPGAPVALTGKAAGTPARPDAGDATSLNTRMTLAAGAGTPARPDAGDADAPGISTDKVVAGFFSFLGFPRLRDADVVRTAIARGVETGLFACTTGRPALGDDGRYRIDRGRIAFERPVAEDEIDLDSGFLIAPAALPAPAAAVVPGLGDGDDDVRYPTPGGGAGMVRDGENVTAGTEPAATGSRDLTISFSADRTELFNAWNALANLADAAGKISVRVQAASDTGFDRAKLENGVLEPLRELGLIDDDQA